MSEELLWLGKDFVQEGEFELGYIFPRVAAGISAGYASSYVSKVDPNEDALCVCMYGDVVLAAVADAHWGCEASEIGVRSCYEFFRRVGERRWSQEEWRGLWVGIEERIRDHFRERDRGLCSETSLLVLRWDMGSGLVEYGSYGDCILMGFGVEGRGVWNRIQRSWLGVMSEVGRCGLDYGVREFSGGHILLCSDGLTEPVYGHWVFGVEEIWGCLEGAEDLEGRGRVLMEEALRRDREFGGSLRGGEDNVAFILIESDM